MSTSGNGPNRRKLLGTLALVLGGIALVALLAKLLVRRTPNRPAAHDLPGDGSIFQPRRDARLEEWERRHGKPHA
jgi:hypothetical protein